MSLNYHVKSFTTERPYLSLRLATLSAHTIRYFVQAFEIWGARGKRYRFPSSTKTLEMQLVRAKNPLGQ